LTIGGNTGQRPAVIIKMATAIKFSLKGNKEA